MISNILRANISAPARRLILIAVAPLLIWGAHPARAQECGDVIGPGGHVSLSNDITSCPEPGPAVKIVGPVSVNLKGYTISCGAAITGVEVQGENARIQNGVVEDCEDGIDVGGDGKHVLLKLTVTSTQNEVGDRGFRVRSDRNHLIDDYADHFNGEGFRIDGDDNRVTNDRATGTFNEGFRINGNDNQIKNNWLRKISIMRFASAETATSWSTITRKAMKVAKAFDWTAAATAWSTTSPSIMATRAFGFGMARTTL